MPESGELIIEQPPTATLGTLWVTGTQGVKIKEVLATTQESKKKSLLSSLDAILKENVGKELVLERTVSKQDQDNLIGGKLLSAEGQVLVLENDHGRYVIPKSRVLSISAGEELVFEKEVTTKSSVLVVSGSGSGNVYTMALQRGLTWAPGYHVDLKSDDKLTLTAKATLINDLVDMKDVQLKLVTGFPHVRFLNTLDPLTSGTTVNQFMNGLLSAGGRAAAPSAMTQNALRRSENGFAGAADFEAFDPGELQGTQLEDLFFYNLDDVSLKRSERSYHMIFQEEADYKHIYTANLDHTNWEVRGGINPPSANPEAWHEIKFKNPTGFPLTTAAASTYQKGELIGQDMLNYVPPGAEAMLKITKALDVQIDTLEEELGRERVDEDPRRSSNVLYKVTGKGTVEIVNRKSEAVQMEIKKSVTGEVVTVTQGGEHIKEASGLRSLNPVSRISWKPTIGAGEKWVATYTFTVYVRV